MSISGLKRSMPCVDLSSMSALTSSRSYSDDSSTGSNNSDLSCSEEFSTTGKRQRTNPATAALEAMQELEESRSRVSLDAYTADLEALCGSHSMYSWESTAMIESSFDTLPFYKTSSSNMRSTKVHGVMQSFSRMSTSA